MKQLMFLTLFSFLSILVVAQAPGQINYQGVARNSTGTTMSYQDISLRLSVRNANDKGIIVYQETRNIKTDRFGMFVVAIGSNGATNVINTIKNVNWSDGLDKFLQVEILFKNEKNFINMGTSKLLSVPYSLAAETAHPIGNAGGSLTGAYPNPQIGGQVVTNYNIADSTITASKIAPGVLSKFNASAKGDITGIYPDLQIVSNAVTNNKIGQDAVHTQNIIDGAITSSKMASGVIPTTLPPSGNAGGDLTGTYPAPTLAANTVKTINIADGSVTASKIATGVLPVTLPPSGNAGGDLTGTYPSPKLSSNVVKTSNLADGSVTASKIASGVLPVTLAPSGNAGGDLTGTYPAPKLSSNVVKTSNIADGSVTASKIASGVLPVTLPPSGNAGGDLTGTYPAPTLSSNVVKTTNIADGSVTASKIASGVIPTTLPPSGIAGGSLSGSYPNPQIGVQVITANNIADSSITAVKLAPGVLTSKKNNGPAGGDLTGTYPNPQIAANVIKSQYLMDGSIITSKIANASVTSAKLASGVIPTSLPPNGNAGGVLSGTYPNPSLATNAVITSHIADGSVTTAKLANGVIPLTLPPSGAAGGDLNGNYPNPGVVSLKGIALGSTAPVVGQVLKFDGTQWAPSPDNTGSFSVPYSSSVNSSSNLFSITNLGGGSAIEGINSTANSNAFGLIGQISSATPALTSAGVRGTNNGNGPNGYGIWGSHAGGGSGVYGSSATGSGVNGFSADGNGVYAGSTTGTGIFATSNDGIPGLFDISNPSSYSDAVFASNNGYANGITSISTYGNGVLGIANDIYGTGLLGINNAGGEAILGFTISDNGSAVVGRNDGTYAAIRGFNTSNNGIGVLALANSWGAANGTALVAELEGSDPGNTAVFKANNANVARIDNTGKGFFNGGTQLGGADIAEYFDVEGDLNNYEPGDVLIISENSDRKVEKSISGYSTLVAGVYATKPGVLLTEKNAEQDALDLMVPMGVIGVLPTKVCLEGGVIRRGDLLVSSSVSGVAMKADLNKVKVGQVLGKALQSFSENGVGKINVLVSVK